MFDIEDIDTNGYLVNHDSTSESENEEEDVVQVQGLYEKETHHNDNIVNDGSPFTNDGSEYKNEKRNIENMDPEFEKYDSALNLWCVQSKYMKVVELAKDSPSDMKKLDTLLGQFLEEQMLRKKSTDVENSSRDSKAGYSQVNMVPQISVRDPRAPVTTKGRPKVASRIKSSLEAPKKRTCSHCKGLGHYINGCPVKKAADAEAAKRAAAQTAAST